MKTLLVLTITFYQKIISPLLHQLLGQQNLCRFDVSCSEFAKQSIVKYGVLTGGKMSINRLLRCQPLTKPYANI